MLKMSVILAYVASTTGIRVVQQPAPAEHTRENSYTAAVVQTVWPFGADCCPGRVDARGCGCAGAESLCGMKQCSGTQEQVANATKIGNVGRIENFISAAATAGAQIVVFSEGALGIGSFTYTAGGRTIKDGGGVASGGLAEPIPDPQRGHLR